MIAVDGAVRSCAPWIVTYCPPPPSTAGDGPVAGIGPVFPVVHTTYDYDERDLNESN